MVPKSYPPKLLVVVVDIFLEADDSWIVFVVCVAFDQTAVEFYYQWKGKLLSGRIVQSPSSLDELDMVSELTYTKCESDVPSGFHNLG